MNVLLQIRSELCEEHEREDILRCILEGQKFIRNANIFRVHVSIRDIMRVIDLYHYFTFNSAGKSLLERGSKHWQALIISIAMGYYFRLSNNPTEKNNRNDFAKMMNEILKECGCRLTFVETVKDAMLKLYNETIIPLGIAKTDALLENLFCTVICIDAKIPLIITGPAGSSKTLSFTIAADNMKGKQSTTSLYKKMYHVHPFRYQCSEQVSCIEYKENLLIIAFY